MEELKIIYGIISSIWKLCKKYGYKQLTDHEWESFVQDGISLQRKFREKGEEFDRLYRDLFAGLQAMYIRKGEKQHEQKAEVRGEGQRAGEEKGTSPYLL